VPENQQQAPDPSAASEGPDLEVTSEEKAAQVSAPDITFAVPNLPAGTDSSDLPYSGKAFLTLQQSSTCQGPYPSPDAVERFEAILPGAFNRILTMAEKAQESQIRATESAQGYLQLDVRRSHYLGAAISVLAVLCSTGCALTGHTVAAVALVGIPVMAVARAFIKTAPESSDDSAAEAQPQDVNDPQEPSG
jgi:uncharacterized membrane protein